MVDREGDSVDAIVREMRDFLDRAENAEAVANVGLGPSPAVRVKKIEEWADRLERAKSRKVLSDGS